MQCKDCKFLGEQTDEILYIDRGTGAIGTIGNITLLSGGSIISSSNGNISRVPNGTGIFYCGTGSPGHLTPTTGEAYFQGKVEFDEKVYIDDSLYNCECIDCRHYNTLAQTCRKNSGYKYREPDSLCDCDGFEEVKP